MRQLLSMGHWFFFCTVASVLRCGVVVKHFLVMVVNDAPHVRQAAVAFTLFLLKKGWRLWCCGKCFLIRLRKVSATVVFTFLLYGRLNQMMFLFLFLFVGAVVFFF